MKTIGGSGEGRLPWTLWLPVGILCLLLGAAGDRLLRADPPGGVQSSRGDALVQGALAPAVPPAETPGQPQSHACRFWGLVGSGYTSEMLEDQLRSGTVNLKELGGANRDGWGFGSFLPHSYAVPLNHPLIRRGGPPANHPADPDYDMAVDELKRILPRAAIGHVRAGSSGHWGIPNPHPFEHEGYIFAHNGTLSETGLVHMLVDDDQTYLNLHPTDYVNGYIDSELYFMVLLKTVHGRPELPRIEALCEGIRKVAGAQPYCRINFVMTQGDTLFALRLSPGDSWDPVRFFPWSQNTPIQRSPFWMVASQALGSRPTSWGTIPPRTLAIFIPGREPQFHPIDGDPGEQPLEEGRSEEQSDPAPAEEPDGRPQSLAAMRDGIGTAEPNPTRGPITVPLQVPDGGAVVTLEIWDVNGRLLRRGPAESRAAGESALTWDGRDREGRLVPGGTYFCRVLLDGRTRSQRVLVIR